MSMILFEKEYSSESLGQDVTRDIWDSFNPQFNPEISDIPEDEHGFLKGTFKVTIRWCND